MTGFSTEWLALREPIDHAARSRQVLDQVITYLGKTVEPALTDIGCGTGSTLRALKPHLIDRALRWHLIDHDEALLQEAKGHAGKDAVTAALVDLNTSLEPVFKQHADIVTTSAFLDLVSEDWVAKLVDALKAAEMPFYAALSYDGRAGCTPHLPDDDNILSAFNRHQLSDKGFGQALGPAAADTTLRLLEAAGFHVFHGQSDWQAGSEHRAFQHMLLDGWLEAACEIEPEKRADFSDWRRERSRLIDNGSASVFVGHVDLFALPAHLGF